MTFVVFSERNYPRKRFCMITWNYQAQTRKKKVVNSQHLFLSSLASAAWIEQNFLEIIAKWKKNCCITYAKASGDNWNFFIAMCYLACDSWVTWTFSKRPRVIWQHSERRFRNIDQRAKRILQGSFNVIESNNSIKHASEKQGAISSLFRTARKFRLSWNQHSFNVKKPKDKTNSIHFLRCNFKCLINYNELENFKNQRNFFFGLFLRYDQQGTFASSVEKNSTVLSKPMQQ